MPDNPTVAVPVDVLAELVGLAEVRLDHLPDDVAGPGADTIAAARAILDGA